VPNPTRNRVVGAVTRRIHAKVELKSRSPGDFRALLGAKRHCFIWRLFSQYNIVRCSKRRDKKLLKSQYVANHAFCDNCNISKAHAELR